MTHPCRHSPLPLVLGWKKYHASAYRTGFPCFSSSFDAMQSTILKFCPFALIQIRNYQFIYLFNTIAKVMLYDMHPWHVRILVWNTTSLLNPSP
jgi:hypothetical protein